MIFEQLNSIACRTYLIASDKSKEAILVDPVLELAQEYLVGLGKRGLHLRYAINTHTHADHISGTAFIGDRTDAQVIMHRAAPSRCVSMRVDDGFELELGEIKLRFLHTPGHTPDSLTLVLPDRIFTGDTLFIGGAGRTDLPGGDTAAHYDSLFGKLMPLAGKTLVFPAHDYRGKTHSVLAEERRSNPYLQKRTREEYVEWLRNRAQPTPDWMLEVLKANLACAQDPRVAWVPVDSPACDAIPGAGLGVNEESVPTKSIDVLREQLRSRSGRPVVVDVREPDEYNGELGHIDDSLLLPLGQLASRLDDLEPYRDRDIVTVCQSGNRSVSGASILTKAGFSHVSSLEGGMMSWNERGLPIKR